MKIFLWIMAALLLLVAAVAGCWAQLGYFSDQLFFPVPAATTPAPGHERIAVVILSGDMGFRVGMGPKIASRFAHDGVPVVGVSSLVYFRQRRTPAEIRHLIVDSIQRGLAFGHADRLVLIGQSFGADMVHVGLVDLPPALRAKLAMVALVVPTDSVDYQASPLELAGLVKPDAPALPTARLLDWVPTLCIQGAEETSSLCPSLKLPNVRNIALPGGHALRRDPDALYAELSAAVGRIGEGGRRP